MIDFDILANENLKNLQHLDISDNPLKGFKSLNNCPNHSLTINIDTLKNFTILEELKTSQCFTNDSHFPAVKIDLTEREAEEPIACGHWCNFNDIMKQNIIIDTPCNCTEETETDKDASATSSGANTGTTSSGLKKVFFVILFLIFLLVIRYHWKTIRSFWFKLRNKNHSDHGKIYVLRLECPPDSKSGNRK